LPLFGKVVAIVRQPINKARIQAWFSASNITVEPTMNLDNRVQNQRYKFTISSG